MRPISLNLSAFGPFADEQNIDFTALGVAPLFLLNGPTGAGKTTLLDAMCFALYGKTTGDEREASQMRCDLAEDHRVTQVTLTFAIGAQTYRIQRMPEQLRPKKHADGFTVQKPEAVLERLHADGSSDVLVASKVSEATRQIEQITGLDAKQFRQVMVLPQGKFRELLLADSKDRERIFSQLFQTQNYRRIEEKLKQQAAQIRQQVAEHRNKREGVLHGVDLDSDDMLAEQLKLLQPQLAQAEKAKSDAAKQHLRANQAVADGQALSAEFATLARLGQQQQSLHQQQADIQALDTKLQLGQKAQQIQPVFQLLGQRRQEAIEADEQCKQQQRALQSAQTAFEQIQIEMQQLPEREQQLQAWRAHMQTNASLLPQLEQLVQLQSELSASQQQTSVGQAKVTQAQAQVEQLEQRQTQTQASLQNAQQQANNLAAEQQQLSVLQNQLAVWQEWQSVQQSLQLSTQQLNQAETEGKTAKQTLLNRQQVHQGLMLDWHRGQAAILASKLEDGTPCPVCGSEAHPQPALSEQTLPSEADLSAAKDQEALAQQHLSEAREHYSAVKAQLQQQQSHSQALKEKLPETAECEALAQAVLSRQKAVDAAQQALQQVNELQQHSQQLNVQHQTLRHELQQHQQHWQSLQQQLAALTAQQAQMQQNLPEDCPTRDGILAQQQQLQQQIDTEEQAIADVRQQHLQQSEQTASLQTACKNAELRQSQTQQAQAQQAQSWIAAWQDAAFDSEQQVLGVLANLDVLPQWQQQVQAFNRAVQENAAQLDVYQQKLKGLIAPDLPKLENALSQAAQQLQQDEASWQQIKSRWQTLQQTQTQLASMDAAAEKLEQEYAVVGTLADVANGQTGNRISLQRFVLSVLLDDVLAEASQRLHLMSKGRYRLLRKEDKAKGRGASGLELEVEDAYTAKLRPVATLSGGESFMAALSLALGLSDVVQAYAGGIKLDTLFIDEGFGSLDQESLDLAIRTLLDLQQSGRMIGIISHVSELKEQINVRIDITKTLTGSHCRLINPDAETVRAGQSG